MTVHKENYTVLCRQFHHSSGEIAGRILANKDQENPRWVRDCSEKKASGWEKFFPGFSQNELLNTLCVTVLACLLISITSTRFTLSAAQILLLPEVSSSETILADMEPMD